MKCEQIDLIRVKLDNAWPIRSFVVVQIIKSQVDLEENVKKNSM